MLNEINIETGLRLNRPIIDVRSPGEFEKGHIPGAVNIPLFSNEERAHVGTVYKQNSREAAIEVGYEYVTPKLNWFIDESLQLAPDKKVVVHCWRGGMRSRSFAQHLTDNGFVDVGVITGGYKAYRNHVLDGFAKPALLRILGGYTGSAKTQLLKALQLKGHQVIDLEGLANHKGSAFGAIGQQVQPTVEQFENNLFQIWDEQDFNRPIWMEDESHSIGSVKIPMPLFLQIRNSMLFFLAIPKEERASYLVQDYTNCDKKLLIQAIERITKRLGGQHVKQAVQYIQNEEFYEAAMIALNYYDKSYQKGMNMRNIDLVVKIDLPNTNIKLNTQKIEEISKQYDHHKINAI